MHQVPGVDDEHPVKDFPPQAAYPAFHDRIRVGYLDRRRDDLNALAGEDRVEHAGELPVPVTDHERELFHTLTKVDEKMTCLGGDPVAGWVSGDAEEVHPAVGLFDDCAAVQSRQQHGVALGKSRTPRSHWRERAGTQSRGGLSVETGQSRRV